MTNFKSKRTFKLLTVLMAILMFTSIFSINASAATTSWVLSKDKTETYSNALGLYYKGGIKKLVTGSTSSDGVYLCLEYSIPGKPWVEAQRILAEPGSTSSLNFYTSLSPKASWRGKLTSWWPGGKNCVASGEIEALN